MADVKAAEFLMVMVHYSWITVLVLCLLGLGSYMSYKRRPTNRRTWGEHVVLSRTQNNSTASDTLHAVRSLGADS